MIKLLILTTLFTLNVSALVETSKCPQNPDAFVQLSWKEQYECKFLGAINQGSDKLTAAEGAKIGRVINAFYRDKSQNYAEVSCLSKMNPEQIHSCFLSTLPEQKEKVTKEYKELQEIVKTYFDGNSDGKQKLAKQKEQMEAELANNGSRTAEQIYQDPKYRDYRLVHHYTGGTMSETSLKDQEKKLKQKSEEVSQVVDEITSPESVALLNKVFLNGPIAQRLKDIDQEFKGGLKSNFSSVADTAIERIKNNLAMCKQSVDFYFNLDPSTLKDSGINLRNEISNISKNECDIVFIDPVVENLRFACQQKDLPQTRSSCAEYSELLNQNESLKRGFQARLNRADILGNENNKKVADNKSSNNGDKALNRTDKKFKGAKKDQGFLDWVSSKLDFGKNSKGSDSGDSSGSKSSRNEDEETGFGKTDSAGVGASEYNPISHLVHKCALNSQALKKISCDKESANTITDSDSGLNILSSFVNTAHQEAGRFYVRNQIISLMDLLENMQFESDSLRSQYMQGALDAMRSSCPSTKDASMTKAAIKDELDNILNVSSSELRDSKSLKANSEQKLDEMIAVASNVLTLKTDIENLSTEFFIKKDAPLFQMLLPCEGIISSVLDFNTSEGKNCPFYGPEKWLTMFEPKSGENPYEKDPKSMNVLKYYVQFDKVSEAEDKIFQIESEIQGINEALKEVASKARTQRKSLDEKSNKLFDDFIAHNYKVDILQDKMQEMESSYGKDSEVMQKFYDELYSAEKEKLSFLQENYSQVQKLSILLKNENTLDDVYQENAIKVMLEEKKSELNSSKIALAKEKSKLNSFKDLDIQPSSPSEIDKLMKMGIRPSVTSKMSQKDINADKEKMSKGIEPSTSRLFRCGMMAQQLLDRQNQLMKELDKLSHLASTIDKSDVKLSDSFTGWVDSFFEDGRVDGLKNFIANAPKLRSSIKDAMTVKKLNPKQHKDIKDYMSRISNICKNPDEFVKDQLEQNPNFLLGLSDCTLQKVNMRSSPVWKNYNEKWENQCNELQKDDSIISLLCLESGTLGTKYLPDSEARGQLIETSGAMIDLATCVPLAGAAAKLTKIGIQGLGKTIGSALGKAATKLSARRASTAAAKGLQSSIANGTKVSVLTDIAKAQKSIGKLVPTSAKLAQRAISLSKAVSKKGNELRKVLVEGINPDSKIFNIAGMGMLGSFGSSMVVDWTGSKDKCQQVLGANQIIGQFTSQEKQECHQKATAYVPMIKMVLAGVALNGVLGPANPKAKPTQLVTDKDGNVRGVISPSDPSKVLDFSDYDNVDLAQVKLAIDKSGGWEKVEGSPLDDMLSLSLKDKISSRKGAQLAARVDDLTPQEKVELMIYEDNFLKLREFAEQKRKQGDPELANKLEEIDRQLDQDIMNKKSAPCNT